MASLFTTAKDAFVKILGRKVKLPFYLQFVPGECVEVVTSHKSIMALESPNNTNSILARAHIYKGMRKRRINGNTSRYS